MKNRIKNSVEEGEETVLRSLYTHGGWFQFPMQLLKELSPAEAVFLAYLISSTQVLRAEERSGGWFYRTCERVEQDIKYNHDQQRRVLRTLKAMKLVTVEQRGMPAKRYVRVNFSELHKLLRDHLAS